jgi:hypothetical protein
MDTYTVDFDYVPSVESGFDLRSRWAIKNVEGGSAKELSAGLYRITITTQPDAVDSRYKRGKVLVTFATNGSK